MQFYQQLSFINFSSPVAGLALFFLLFVASCRDETLQGSAPAYFDMSAFIEAEAQRLQSNGVTVSKTAFLNGKQETKTIPVADWKHELNAFTEADISKKSFLGKYTEEVVKNDTQLTTRYTAQEDNLRTRKLEVTYGNDGTPVKISAVLYTANALYSSHQQLTYERNTGFWISGKQTVRFLEPDTFAVAAIFQP